MKRTMSKTRRSALLCIGVLAVVTAVVLSPIYFQSSASGRTGQGLFEVTSVDEGLEDYDIRTSKVDVGTIIDFRQSEGNALRSAELRSNFVDAETALRRSIPTLKVEYNPIPMVPELIAPDVLQGRAVMTGPSTEVRSAILRGFAKSNNDLIGMRDEQLDSLKVAADYTNPDGNLSFASLEQFINGIPVFRGEIKAGFTKRGEMFRVINNLASGLEYENLSREFGDPANAVRIAAADVKAEVDMTPNTAESTDLKAVFGTGYYPATASKYYFPIEPGLARAAWYVIVWKPVNGYEMMIDAETGKILFRQNMGKDQTQAVTYNVWANTASPMLTMDSPSPLSPGPIDPSLGTQGTLQPRTMVTLVGNEAPNQFNNNGWINDNANTTEGNNTIAGLDRSNPDGVDTALAGSAIRVFDYASTPPPGTPAPGGYPLPDGQATTPCGTAVLPTSDAQRAAVVQMFFVVNRLHDVLYRHGFTEQARNFQLNNFGRGGIGSDRVLAEGQDCSGTNNANFNSVTTDGTPARMQMYIFSGPTPDRDGTLDGDIIVHEVAHGVTNRLHTGGISGTQGGQMHEGNGDFLAHLLMSESTDPINGVYSMGGYATYAFRVTAPFSTAGNYYYGIRRFPKAVITSTGGPLNRPHNPLTYADIDPAQHNVTDGAYGAAFGGSASAAHDGGEVWSSMLWEVRSRLVQRLGHADGTSKMLQLTLDGMKMAVSTTSMLNSRNAILAAAQASAAAPDSGPDVADVWAGFAARGLGFGATNPTGNTVVESFGLPNLIQTPTFTVSDASGDGFPQPGESLTISVPLTNNTGAIATGVSLQLVGGGSANYGTIDHGQTVSQNVSFTVPAKTPCGALLTLTFNANSSIGPTSFTRSIIVGVPVTTFSENFDGVTAPAFPAGWTSSVVFSGSIFVATTNNTNSAPNAAFAIDPATVGGGTVLVTPSMPVPSSTAVFEFRNRYDTEAGWDGGVLEISINGGVFQDVILAGGSFIQNGYNGAIGSNGVNNPLNGRNSWSGNSNGYVTTSVRLPASAAGQNVQLRFYFGADNNTVGQGPNPGWYIDNVRLIGSFACISDPTASPRADFDGDGRTDISVFRPSEGNWYLNRSTAGLSVVSWGLSDDVQAPGDFDGDNKADTAVFRASTGTWWILRSAGGIVSAPFGVPGDIPVVGDYDGDGVSDVAVFRPSNSTWYVQNSGGGFSTVAFGASGDLPVRGDYNGDGVTDIAIYRPSTATWWIANSGGGVTTTNFGLASDKVVPADYDGDSKDDIAVYRPETGAWFVLRSTNGGVDVIPFGNSTDIPVPGDYDGDGRDDQAIYRNGTWWLNRSTAGVTALAFGLSTDTPIPSKYIP